MRGIFSISPRAWSSPKALKIPASVPPPPAGQTIQSGTHPSCSRISKPIVRGASAS
jgi:hypothetical protein